MTSEYKDEQPPGPFLRRKLAEAAAAVVELAVLGVDGSQTRVDTWPVSLGLDDIRDEIEQRSSRHAALGPSLANFVVKVLDERGSALGFDTFRVAASVAAGRNQLMSEPANEAGITAQLMRHNEVIMRTLTANLDRIMHHQNERLAASDRRASAHEDTYLRTMELFHDLEDRQAARLREGRKLDSSLKLKQQAGEKLLSLGSVVLDGVLGRAPQGAPAAAALLAREVFGSIKSEQLQTILGVLDQEQQIKLLAAYKRFAEAEIVTQGEHGNGKGSDAH